MTFFLIHSSRHFTWNTCFALQSNCAIKLSLLASYWSKQIAQSSMFESVGYLDGSNWRALRFINCLTSFSLDNLDSSSLTSFSCTYLWLIRIIIESTKNVTMTASTTTMTIISLIQIIQLISRYTAPHFSISDSNMRIIPEFQSYPRPHIEMIIAIELVTTLNLLRHL